MDKRVLRFEDVFLRIINRNNNLRGKYAELISGISGEVVSGRLSVIMGGSGSSKTSLLNLLVGKVESSTLTSGTITLDGEQRGAYKWLSRVSYLEQFDTFMPTLTVEESIRYALIFKGREIKPSNIPERINNIIDELGLDAIRGSLLSSISGGERKRAMLAVELVVEPDVIFLDEPTAGLDSHLALGTVEILGKYARTRNKIVLMTVHQPGDGMFNLFDDIIFLDRGRIFYSGPVSEMNGFLAANGLVKPPELSISEYLSELHTKNPKIPSEDVRSKVEKMRSMQVIKRVDEDTFENNNQHCIISTISWNHVWHLLIRQLKVDYRSNAMKGIFLFKMLLSTLLFVFLCDKMKYFTTSLISSTYPSYVQSGPRYIDDLHTFLTQRYEHLGVTYETMLDFLAYNMVPFLTLFSIFNDSAFLDRETFLQKESFTCEYSQFSLFVSILIYECAFALFRSLYFCLLLGLTQLRVVLTVRTIMMFILIPLGMVVFMNLVKSLSCNTYPLNIMRVAAFVLTTFLRSLWLSKSLEELENRYTFMKYLYPGSYAFFLFPFLILDALFYVSLSGRSSVSPGFISFLEKANRLSVDPNMALNKILNSNITFLNKHFLSDELLIMLTIFSFVSTLVLSMMLLILKFSPKIRLILSIKSLRKRLDEVMVIKG